MSDDIERRLQSGYMDRPDPTGVTTMDARIAALTSARRPARPTIGASHGPRSPWLFAVGSVAGLAVLLVGAAAVTTPRTPAATLQAAVVSPTGSLPATPAVVASAEPRPTIPTMPEMDARRIVVELENGRQERTRKGGGRSVVFTHWWSPGRLLGQFRHVKHRDGRVSLGLGPSADAMVVLEARDGGEVWITSRSFTPGRADPLGCAKDGRGRYRIAATETRLEIAPIADVCAARIAAVAGTWLAAMRWFDAAPLLPGDGIPNLDAFRFDRPAAGLADWSTYSNPGLRPVREEGSHLNRAWDVHRPDATVRFGFPVTPRATPCAAWSKEVGVDPPMPSVRAAIDALRARPGLRVLDVQELPGPGYSISRVEVAIAGDSSPCREATLFDALDKDDRAMWPVPTPVLDQDASTVYLAEVPGRDGQPLVVAAMVMPADEAGEAASRAPTRWSRRCSAPSTGSRSFTRRTGSEHRPHGIGGSAAIRARPPPPACD